MRISTVKNILIAVLLIVNVFFILLIIDADRGYNVIDSKDASNISVFAEKYGIEVAPALIPQRYVRNGVIQFTGSEQYYERLATSLLLSINEIQTEEDLYLYKNEQGDTVSFSADGGFEYNKIITADYGVTKERMANKTAKDFIKLLGYPENYYEIYNTELINDTAIIKIKQTVKDNEIFSVENDMCIELEIKGNTVVKALGKWFFGEQKKVNSTEQDVLNVIMSLAKEMEQQTTVGKMTVISIEQGYIASISNTDSINMGSVNLHSAFRITFENGRIIYRDAVGNRGIE